MVLTVRTNDGRTSFCTASAEKAASYMKGLGRRQKPSVTDINGRTYTLSTLKFHLSATDLAVS
jgi:hypothetical protein